MQVISGPAVETRPARPYLGIRTVTPFRGMLRERDALLTELYGWFDGHGMAASSFFLRLHVIDMNGPMDIEVGAIVDNSSAGDGRVRPGTLPAGEYATLTYRDHSVRANRTLLEWAAAGNLRLDREDVAGGDRFACRYELYLTDPRTEPRKTRWDVRLDILTRPRADDAVGAARASEGGSS